jgi:hypothetical protein
MAPPDRHHQMRGPLSTSKHRQGSTWRSPDNCRAILHGGRPNCHAAAADANFKTFKTGDFVGYASIVRALFMPLRRARRGLVRIGVMQSGLKIFEPSNASKQFRSIRIGPEAEPGA